MASGTATIASALAAALGAAVVAAAQAPDVEVELDLFGTGSAYRPGDMAGIRLLLSSNLREPTRCRVQWEVPNAEGDVAELTRSVTLGPGTPVELWLYAMLPPQCDSRSVWVVRVFEERDGQRQRELGGARISPSVDPLDIGMAAIAVVGQTDMNLSEYDTSGGGRTRIRTPTAHEPTRVVAGIHPRDLPDRWEGLKCFEAVAWSTALPQDLRVDSAEALREYVRRGGHLIISLPQGSDPWGLGSSGQTYLDDLLPRRAPRVDEGIRLSALMPVLSKSDTPPRDIEVAIRVFKEIGGEFDAIDGGYEPLVALPDGRVVVMQRTFGFGRITLCGIDLSGQLRSMRLPEADVFWNRVLGRRADAPRGEVLQAMADAKLLRIGSPEQFNAGDGRPIERALDQTRQADIGILLSLVLFGSYLIAAGPGGFYLLKKRGLVRHSWVAFAAVAAVFTAIAWGTVRLRFQGTAVRHVTLLDHVARSPLEGLAGQPHLQRCIAFLALYDPGYVPVRVSLGSEPGQRDLLTTWTAPEMLPQRFPNVDRYPIDVGQSPADYEIPVRASATQFYANWLGALDPAWGGLIRIDPDDPVRVVEDVSGRRFLAGTLVSELPSVLRDVSIIWITDQRRRRIRYATDDDDRELPWAPVPDPMFGRPLLNEGYHWRKGLWNPGSAFVLSQELGDREKSGLGTAIHEVYVRKAEKDAPSGLPTRQDLATLTEMLSLYHQLTPPKYQRTANKDPDTIIVTRRVGREIDLSPWFNRPCLIIMGTLRDSPSPLPFRVDGREPDVNSGLTVVRWVYPLPVDETRIPEETAEEAVE